MKGSDFILSLEMIVWMLRMRRFPFKHLQLPGLDLAELLQTWAGREESLYSPASSPAGDRGLPLPHPPHLTLGPMPGAAEPDPWK